MDLTTEACGVRYEEAKTEVQVREVQSVSIPLANPPPDFVGLIFSRANYGRMYLGVGGDPIVYIWCLNWWPWAIAHRLNPFVTYYVWFPHGINLTWANSVASAALLMLPVIWLANSVASFNVLSLLAPALSAWVGFLPARYLTQDMFASFIGGYMFGFSSYEIGQMHGAMTFDLSPVFL